MSPKATEALLSEVTTAPPSDEKITEDKQEIEETDNGPCAPKEAVFNLGDAVFASVIVAPLVVGVWRGTWGIMDLQAKLFPYPQSFLIGIIIQVCFGIMRYHLFARSRGAWSSSKEAGAGVWVRERILSRVYTYVFILACIMFWRGGWGIMDSFVIYVLPKNHDPHRPVMIAAIVIACIITLLYLRAAKNMLAPPYFLCTDGKEPTYVYTTRFRTSSREVVLYILDCVFSVCVIGSLVVFVWRGSWALLDIYLFPDDQPRSCFASLIGGYTLVIITFSLQAPLRWCAARLHGAPRLLLADLYHLMSFLATVNVWRGVWGILDLYLFPDSPKLSNWCTHLGSLALLMLLNCSNSVLVRGVYIDAEEPAGECVVFPCHYLRLYFYKERIKKRHKRALSVAAAARKNEEASITPLQFSHNDDKV